MNELSIPSMPDDAVQKIRSLEAVMLAEPNQIDIPISHTLHAGVYSRTAIVPQGVLIAGALIKVPTILIISGDVVVSTGNESITLTGYNVITADKNRKQAFLALSEVHMTMLFATAAKTLEEAEEEFTDEADSLQSRRPNYNNGDKKCQELLSLE